MVCWTVGEGPGVMILKHRKTHKQRHQTTNRKYPQMDILFPIGDSKSPIEYVLPNWGLGIYFLAQLPGFRYP